MEPLSAEPLTPELVQQHGRGLRTLAHGLLADVHAAEEVVQETWMAALERPPRAERGLAGWLRQVTRHLALKRHRGETRRVQREQRAARPESLAPTDEVVAQREVLRRVIDAVLALEEPYQTVVILRFFQDLPPREIARRRGARVVTVNSQIQRALRKLRDHLDAEGGKERGQWACALAVTTGWERAVPVAGPPASRPRLERWAMDWKLWMGASGAAAVAALGSMVAGSGSGASPEQGAQAAQASSSEASATSAQAGGNAEQPAARQDDRRPALAPQPASPEGQVADAVYHYELTGVVVDTLDMPVGRARVLLAPAMQPLCDAGGTDRDGRFRVAWIGSEARMKVAFAISRSGLSDLGMQELELVAGTPLELRIGVRYAGLMERRPAPAGQPTHAKPEEARREVEVAARRQVLEASPGRGAPIVLDEAGLATFQWAVPNVLDKRPVVAVDARKAQEEQVRYRQALEQRQREARSKEALGSTERAPGAARVLVLVLDALREPVAGVHVRALASDGAEYGGVSDETGALVLEPGSGAAWLELRAGGGDHGIASGRVELIEEGEAKQQAEWTAVLDRGNEVRGALESGAEGGFERWVVEFQGGSPAARWSDTTEVAAASFALPNLAAGPGVLLLRASATEVLPRIVVPHVDPGPEAAAIELELADPGVGSLRVALTDDQGEIVEDADVRVWQLASGRAVRMSYDAEAHQYARAELPAGRYRVTAGSLVNGYRELGQVEVIAGEEASLGTAVLPAAGELAFAPGASSWSLLRREAGVSTLVGSGSADFGFHGRLPEGEYVIVRAGEDGVPSELCLTIEAGQATKLDE